MHLLDFEKQSLTNFKLAFTFQVLLSTVDEGCVAICEEGNKRIQVFVDDQSEMCIEDLENPCGVALSPNNIFVTDIDANVVKVYTRDGEERGTIGEWAIQQSTND